MVHKITLYYMPVSPASRAVVLVAKAIDIDLDLREIDISRGEHMTPEYLKVSNYISCSICIKMQLSLYLSDKSSAHTSSLRR